MGTSRSDFEADEREKKKIGHGDKEFLVEITSTGYMCPLRKCRRTFKSEMSLGYHLSEQHGIYAKRTNVCEWCGEEYTYRKKGRKYCSISCSNKAMAGSDASKEATCEFCGDVFEKSFPSQERKYCSVDCSNKDKV